MHNADDDRRTDNPGIRGGSVTTAAAWKVQRLRLDQTDEHFGTIQQMGYSGATWTDELLPPRRADLRPDADAHNLLSVFRQTPGVWLKPTDFSGSPPKSAE